MKRIIICAILLTIAVTVSLYSYLRVKGADEELNMRVDAMLAALPSEDSPELLKQAQNFIKFWEAEEDVLEHIVRHSYIDVITSSSERLPSLAEHGNFAELSAELAVIRRQMEHILSSEMLSLDNLL